MLLNSIPKGVKNIIYFSFWYGRIAYKPVYSSFFILAAYCKERQPLSRPGGLANNHKLPSALLPCLAMGKTITNTILMKDLDTLLRSHSIKENYSAIVKCLIKKNTLNFETVSHKIQQEDGITEFHRVDERNKRKHVTVKIKDSVFKSKHVCWRLAILSHELAHVLHFWNSTTPISDEDTHGEDWVNMVKDIMKRGNLKQCAMKLESPPPMCIYKKKMCVYCAPGTTCEKMVQKVYILPKVLEKSPFGGHCYFCRTVLKIIYHLRQSHSCREDYEDRYGPQYKAILKKLTYKENRANRRVGKYSGPSICEKCQASGDQGLVVHLRYSEKCRKKYKYKTEKVMRRTIQKGNANKRKQKQRDNQTLGS